MTPRERYIRTLTFGKPDRIYYAFGKPRKSTLEAWYAQGLPLMSDAGEYGCPAEFWSFMGMDPSPWAGSLPLNTSILPAFEQETLREDDRGRIWRDENGIVMHDAGNHLATPGFRTRSYLRHPVGDKKDWTVLRDRFDPHTKERYPADWDSVAKSLVGHEHPIQLTVQGLFWKCRDWVGFEELCVMFYDNPDLVHAMMEHNTIFIMEVLRRALEDVEVDCVLIGEDMAYKHA